ncbi:hypothetical protein DVH24_030526 [Malus domestica]|uniref:Isopenicillin N synthase-like Fe(2+) 2OG dioxygenase domain-containing protein n=1 Tax=Malus domestica TaxID=3750 RepID=A0A498JXU5_MALDO|nr:hypothetical protein DVH24_030526 [Malus domestica]
MFLGLKNLSMFCGFHLRNFMGKQLEWASFPFDISKMDHITLSKYEHKQKVTNHGIPGSLMESVISWLSKVIGCMRISINRKQMIRRIESDPFWAATPEESCSTWEHVPPFILSKNERGLSLQEYSERMRDMGIQLLRGISKSLGLEECYIEKKMKLESGYNILGPSYYPALSNFSIGQFPHRDPSLLVLVARNVGRGVQIQHQAKWLHADSPPGSILVIAADHMEVRPSY